MKIPFTTEQFFEVFDTYNTAIWPAQVFAYLLGVITIVLVIRPSRAAGRIISAILASFWLWIGVFYHIIYFSTVNPAAWFFGVLYIVQGILFLLVGTVFGKLSFRLSARPVTFVGTLLILYAMVIYPLLGMYFGHSYPRAPIFGVSPCPLTIFTFGLLLWSAKLTPPYLLAIPLVWSLIGMSAAINLRVTQDYGLVVAGIIGTAFVFVENRKMKKPARGMTL